MIELPYTSTYPETMMIELSHTSLTGVTVLGTIGLHYPTMLTIMMRRYWSLA